jgi:hypothetical protein
MSPRMLILFIVSLGTLLFAGNPRSKAQGEMTTVKSAQSGKGTNALSTATRDTATREVAFVECPM